MLNIPIFQHYIKGISELLNSIDAAYHSAFIKLATPKLTRVLKEAVNRQPPTHKGNFRPKMRYAHQEVLIRRLLLFMAIVCSLATSLYQVFGAFFPQSI